MASLSPDVTAALATLRSRWGAAAPRQVGEVVGALATVPFPDELAGEPEPHLTPAQGVISTGFETLDAILGSGGLPRSTCVGLRGDGSSGKTTLALRAVAQAQTAGSIVAWLDLTRSFDPVEAVARGVSLDWLVVVTPADLDEGLSIAGALLSGRAVDLLVVDLPPGRSNRPPPGAPRVGDRLHRLAALARRAESLLILLEPPVLPADLRTAVTESAGLRLELERRGWLRLGRDVVGQLTEAVVARNRSGPPGRRAELRILYADGDEREACLWRDELVQVEPSPELLRELPTVAPSIPVPGTIDDATSPPLLATPPPRSRPRPLRLVPEWSGHHRRPAVDRRDGHRRRPAREGARRPTGDPARERTPARA
jgi:hypothetical protein